ncbi:MAG TPA: hypothetical protein VNY53_00800 [Bradyrhizobium sp.]|jgi:hypothetical protein|nr:hypothetical protein [Bradyrhizobium sp.]
MGDTSSVTPSTSFIDRQVADLKRAQQATTASFASALHHVETAIGLRARTGFTTSGATYEANTLAGRTRATFNNALDATKAALHIKP